MISDRLAWSFDQYKRTIPAPDRLDMARAQAEKLIGTEMLAVIEMAAFERGVAFAKEAVVRSAAP